MTRAKKLFIKNLSPKTSDRAWCVSVFGWRLAPDGTVSGEVVEAVETNNLSLALLAAHHLLDVHTPHVTQMVTVEIAAAELIDRGLI